MMEKAKLVRVSGYIRRPVYERFKQFVQEEEYTTDSSAVGDIIEKWLDAWEQEKERQK
jgi:hypothetical protein